jgi:hypothetical protein
MTDYAKLASNAERLVAKTGRIVTFNKLVSAPANPARPWEGAADHIVSDSVVTYAVFAIGNTSIPTESRGLAFDWVDKDLLRSTRHVVLVAAKGLPSLLDHKVMLEAGKTWSIIWGQLLQPGPIGLLYVFGLKE